MYIYIQRHNCCTCHLSSVVVTDRAGVQPRPQPNPAVTDFGMQPYSRTQPQSAVLMVFTSVIHVNTWINTHLPTPKGWKAELAQLAEPQRTVYRQSDHLLTIRRTQSTEVRLGNVRRPKPTSLPVSVTKPANWCVCLEFHQSANEHGVRFFSSFPQLTPRFVHIKYSDNMATCFQAQFNDFIAFRLHRVAQNIWHTFCTPYNYIKY